MAFPLGTLSKAQFLKRYWQKRPLLVRQAFPFFPELVSPDELAGLSCEESLVSRIILEKGGAHPWEVRRGPFKASSFKKLPPTHWTLLVNGVDRYVPAVNDLLGVFSFIPNWRIDDVMISYAVKKGNVGAHVDNFDVFLIQASGTREWQIESKPLLKDAFKPNLDVRLLQKFKPDQRWKLEPGDMLYLPPRVPHHGIAVTDDCMTYSVGFRAPTHAELIDSAATYSLSKLDETLRYSDPDLTPQHPGEISQKSLKRVKQILESVRLEGDALTQWFGQISTTPKDDDVEIPVEPPLRSAALLKQLNAGAALCRAEGSRVAFARSTGRGVWLFTNGESLLLPAGALGFAKLLSEFIELPTEELLSECKKPAHRQLLLDLVNRGVFYFPGVL